MYFVCERAVGPARTCDFRSGRNILRQTVEPEQMRKLLAEGRTDLLTDFVSNRTGRKFKAFLVRAADGKVGFEFEARVKREGAATKGKAAAAKGKAATAKGKSAAAKAATGKPAARKTAKKKAPARKPAAKKKADA